MVESLGRNISGRIPGGGTEQVPEGISEEILEQILSRIPPLQILRESLEDLWETFQEAIVDFFSHDF